MLWVISFTNREPTMSARLTLFSTAGCHLCEEAHALIARCLDEPPGSACLLEVVDIADNPDLMDRYGTTIPVLRNEESGVELNWPFGAEDVHGIL